MCTGTVIDITNNLKAIILKERIVRHDFILSNNQTYKNITLSKLKNKLNKEKYKNIKIEDERFGKRFHNKEKTYTIIRTCLDDRYVDLIDNEENLYEHILYRDLEKNINNLNNYKEERYIETKSGKIYLKDKLVMKNGLSAFISKIHKDDTVDVEFESCISKTNHKIKYTAIYQDIKDFVLKRIKNPYVVERKSIIEDIFVYYFEEYGFKKTKLINIFEDKDISSLMEFDLYNNDLKVAIEIDGSMHNMPALIKTDNLKNNLCKENNIKLFRIRMDTCKMDKNSHCYIYKRNRISNFDYSQMNDIINDIFKELKINKIIDINNNIDEIYRLNIKQNQ